MFLEIILILFKGVNVVIDVVIVWLMDNYMVEIIDWWGKVVLIEFVKLVKVKKFIFFLLVDVV